MDASKRISYADNYSIFKHVQKHKGGFKVSIYLALSNHVRSERDFVEASFASDVQYCENKNQAKKTSQKLERKSKQIIDEIKTCINKTGAKLEEDYTTVTIEDALYVDRYDEQIKSMNASFEITSNELDTGIKLIISGEVVPVECEVITGDCELEWRAREFNSDPKKLTKELQDVAIVETNSDEFVTRMDGIKKAFESHAEYYIEQAKQTQKDKKDIEDIL